MSTHRTRTSAAANDVNLTPQVLAVWLSAFRDCFTAPAWNHVLVLVAGAVLAPGKRTVSQALRVMGLAAKPGFARYHEVLSRARWDGRAVAHKLLAQVLDAFLPAGEVVIGIDDTIERRWGAKIKARGIYRDPVRSSHGPFRQGEWSALAVAHGHGTDPLGRPALGVAIPDGSRTLGALEQRARSAAQETDRLDASGDSTGQALAAGSPPHHRRRRQLRRPRLDRRDPPPSLPDHKTADRCQPVRPGPTASAGADGPATAERPALAEARGRAGQSQDRLVADQRDGMVRRSAAQAGNRLRRRGLVSLRTAAGADPLGAGARSLRRTRTAGISQHRTAKP